ncbi:MAG: response regulator [Oscillospiraceae bacterium]|nr:response regulator [Oscillospiraceae bacterium]
MEKSSILIVDDAAINREILADCFEGKYNTLQAENGKQALEILENTEVSAILLDLMMPVMGGIEMLEKLNSSGLVKRVPVLVITTATAADSEELLLEAYRLGAVDIIPKPFIANFLICRVENMIELFRHRRELEDMVAEQVKKLSAMHISMVQALAELIEFRDCESGEHVKRICGITNVLLHSVAELYPEYELHSGEIRKMVISAMLHDIGKISVPDSILGKPGRLTPAEFEIMKRHTVSGWEILEKVSDIIDEDIYAYCRDICRHHHERWDGKGYPDGLAGDEITIWSQVVSIADVYDALTSRRVYKSAFSHEKAVQMIKGGECGCFNPKILAAFEHSINEIRTITGN